MVPGQQLLGPRQLLQLQTLGVQGCRVLLLLLRPPDTA